MSNAINRFEIPASDLPRAQRLCETVPGRAMRRESTGGHEVEVDARA